MFEKQKKQRLLRAGPWEGQGPWERNEEREISVLVTGSFKASVEIALDRFPNRKAPRLDHHAATGFGDLGQIGSANDLLVPLGKVLGAGRGDGCLVLAHVRVRKNTNGWS